MSTGSVLNALLLADARLPTGAHAYSAGLEPGVIAGLSPNEVYPYMLARLRTIARLEAGACILAYRLAVAGADATAYRRLEAAIDARTPSAAQRDASRALGRALLRLARSLRPDHPGVTALGILDGAPTRPVALGALGAALAVGEAHCAEVCCYEDLQTVAAAALKLLPVDPLAATRWVVDAGSRIAEIVDRASIVRDPGDLPAFSAPWMEHWAENHAHGSRRLFVA